MLERRGKSEEAYELFNKAVQIAPENVLVRYRRAKLLIAMENYNVRVLTLIRGITPLADTIGNLGGD